MGGISTVTGVKRVQDRLNQEIAGIAGFTAGSLSRAAMVAIRDAQKNAPIMTGELRQMAFVNKPRQTGGAFFPTTTEVAFGFEGPYAQKTHENPRSGRTGGFSPRGRRYKQYARKGRAFFFSKALRRNQRKMLTIIARSAIKGLGRMKRGRRTALYAEGTGKGLRASLGETVGSKGKKRGRRKK